jgi:hypothetical protein
MFSAQRQKIEWEELATESSTERNKSFSTKWLLASFLLVGVCCSVLFVFSGSSPPSEAKSRYLPESVEEKASIKGANNQYLFLRCCRHELSTGERRAVGPTSLPRVVRFVEATNVVAAPASTPVDMKGI